MPAHARAGREHLCRYLLRPPLALERLSESSHGQLLYELAYPRADGATQTSYALVVSVMAFSGNAV